MDIFNHLRILGICNVSWSWSGGRCVENVSYLLCISTLLGTGFRVWQLFDSMPEFLWLYFFSHLLVYGPDFGAILCHKHVEIPSLPLISHQFTLAGYKQEINCKSIKFHGVNQNRKCLYIGVSSSGFLDSEGLCRKHIWLWAWLLQCRSEWPAQFPEFSERLIYLLKSVANLEKSFILSSENHTTWF